MGRVLPVQGFTTAASCGAPRRAAHASPPLSKQGLQGVFFTGEQKIQSWRQCAGSGFRALGAED